MNGKHAFLRFGGFGGCERGAIAVELAVIMSLLTTLVIGVLEYAQAIHQSIALEHAARAGAEYALRFPNDTNGIQAAVANAGTVDSANLTVTTTQFCECPNGTSIDCAGTCTGSVLPNQYVQIAVAQPAQDTLAATGLLSGRVVQGSAVLRLR
jgi:Flp pilus assembly protein TadG